MGKVHYVTQISKLTQLSELERRELERVTKEFVFRANDYYLSLINWSDPDDPLRRLIVPSINELEEFGKWDASDEEANYVAPGCQHKYKTTALLLVSEVCGAYCRYCFRKRLFRPDVSETSTQPDEAIEYIHQHPEINNVLLTGGDPLMLSTARLGKIIASLREIEHVKVIRIGSKMPVFNPMRIYEDPQLLDLFREYSSQDRRIYVIAHINHPREVTPQVLECIKSLHNAGVVTVNQTPVLRGINDNPVILGELLDVLSWAGVTPYYFFINRPVAGNSDFALPLKEVYDIVEAAKARTSGLGKRVRLVMSHSSGKIEILAIENGTAYLKYHQSRRGNYGQFMMLPCPDQAMWFDDLPGNEEYWDKPVVHVPQPT